jgi:ABC-type lipopolysaccharide export system ATPase subunit
VKGVSSDVTATIFAAIKDIWVILGALAETVDALFGRVTVSQRKFVEFAIAVVVDAVALLLFHRPFAPVRPDVVAIGKTLIAGYRDAVTTFTAVDRGLWQRTIVATIAAVVGILEVVEQGHADTVAVVTSGRALA